MKKILLLFLGISSLGFGQVEKAINPYSFSNAKINNISSSQKVVNPNKSVQEALREDEIDKLNGEPPRFGLLIDVNFNLKNSGIWEDTPEGGKLWRLKIKSPSAKSINLIYDKFHIPEGATMHLYNDRKSHIIGAFTSQNNKGTLEKPGKFATGLVYGDELVIEYYQGPKIKSEPIIAISGVIHGYKFIKLLKKFVDEDLSEAGYGDSGACQVDINCPEGNDWQEEKKGVAMMLISSGTRWCSGSLVNNTDQNSIPYFLTADHCLSQDNLDATGDSDASDYMFYWNYESPTCNSSTLEPAIFSSTGATVRANNVNSDFALLELIESPGVAGYDIFYNGWDRTSTPNEGGAGIHHPSGDIKKISTHNQIPGPGQLNNANEFWRVNWMATPNGFSVTEGGSSGSPLFMNNGRVIGQLYGGSNLNCLDPANDPGEYGRFDISWNGTSPQRRLRDWLDPSGSNAMFVDGEEVLIAGPNEACVGEQVTFEIIGGVPATATINWQYPNSKMYIVSGQGTETCILKSFTPGTNQIITAQVTINGVQTSYTRTIDLLSTSPGPTPSIIIAPDNPNNLTCCGQQYSFRHAVCSSNCSNLIEWDYTIYSQNSQDYYGFSDSGNSFYITAQKNTYSPLIIGARARSISECGSPSSWSNEISRYYGTVSGSSTTMRLMLDQNAYNDEMPLLEYFLNSDKTLYLQSVELYSWLDFKFSNKNLNKKEIAMINSYLKNEYLTRKLGVKIYNFFGGQVYNKEFDHTKEKEINLSYLPQGYYFVEYDYMGNKSTRKIIIE